MQSSVTDASLAYLAPLSALRTLSLKGCTNIAGPGLSAITGLAHLRSLDCTGCTRLTNKGGICPRPARPDCPPTCIPTPFPSYLAPTATGRAPPTWRRGECSAAMSSTT